MTVGDRAAEDLLSDVLRSLHLSGSLLVRARVGRPFGLGIRSFDAPVFHVVLAGRAWLTTPLAPRPVALDAGDLVVVWPGDAHAIVDTPGARTESVLDLARANPGVPCPAIRCGGRRIETDMLCGIFRIDRGDVHPLIGGVPPILHFPAGEQGDDLRASLALIVRALAAANRPGAAARLDRALGLLFIDVIRRWAETGDPSGWLAAVRDPRIHAALACMHREPARAWELVELAAAAAMSRSAFAARFRAVVGDTPQRYLARWRIHRAASLLRGEPTSIAQVAAFVGYESEATFSHAFKRYVGLAPGEYRRMRPWAVELPVRAEPGRRDSESRRRDMARFASRA